MILADEVHERRDIGALGMGATLGLLELLRVAQEDDVLRGARSRQRRGERHLPRLVDEEVIERAGRAVVGPEPDGAPHDGSGADGR